MGIALTAVCLAAASAQTVPQLVNPQLVNPQPIEWIAAVVNGEPIMWSELKLEMTLQQRPLDDPIVQHETLTQLIHQRLILQGARAIVLIEDWQVERNYRESSALLRPFLEAGVSPEELRERLKNEMVAEEFIRRIVKSALPNISPERVKRRFDERAALYAEREDEGPPVLDERLKGIIRVELAALDWIEAEKERSNIWILDAKIDQKDQTHQE